MVRDLEDRVLDMGLVGDGRWEVEVREWVRFWVVEEVIWKV